MRILTVLMAAAVLAACKQNPELPAVIAPYKIDIQQGNVVTQEMVAKLKAGLTRSQVRFVLGSPLVTDMFHADRWDYIYLLQRQGKTDERRRLTVIFDGDKLLRLEGDVTLTEKMQEPDAPAAKPAAPVAPAPKPAAAGPSLKPDAAKPVEKPAVVAKPAPKAEPAPAAPAVESKSTAAVTDSANPPSAPSTRPDIKSDAAAPAQKADAGKTDAAKADTTATDDKKDAPKRGAFGRMLDKIGF